AKGGQTTDVFFYDVEADGWSLDDKRQPLLAELKLGAAPRQPLTSEDHSRNNLPDAIACWRQRKAAEQGRLRTAQNFFVPKGEIIDKGYDLSISRYKEVVHEEREHRTPQNILADLRDLEDILR